MVFPKNSRRFNLYYLFHRMEMDYIYLRFIVLKGEETNRGQGWSLREVWGAQEV
jgi:hypothetical protein